LQYQLLKCQLLYQNQQNRWLLGIRLQNEEQVLVLIIEKRIVQEAKKDFKNKIKISEMDTIRYAERTRINDAAMREVFGITRSMIWAGDVWSMLLEQVLPDDPTWTPLLKDLIKAGTLATRIGKPLRRYPSHAELHATYAELAECLAAGRLFRVG
jgi:hypothetical protein